MPNQQRWGFIKTIKMNLETGKGQILEGDTYLHNVYIWHITLRLLPCLIYAAIKQGDYLQNQFFSLY